MTIEEMISAVELGLQKIDSAARDDFLPQEIVDYLNKAQIEFVKDRFQGMNEPGFEQDAKRVSDLQELVTTNPLVPIVESTLVILGSPHELLLPYPDDYMFHVTVEVGITRTANPVMTGKTYVP